MSNREEVKGMLDDLARSAALACGWELKAQEFWNKDDDEAAEECAKRANQFRSDYKSLARIILEYVKED